MPQSPRRLLLLLLVAGPVSSFGAEPTPDQIKFFETAVRPVLANNCFKCHGADRQRGGLRLDSLSAVLTGGDSGAAIVPGKPEESLLIEAINRQSLEMPPDKPLPDKEIAALTAWVKLGAPWPGRQEIKIGHGRTERITDEDRAFWSFQPVKRPSVPKVDDAGWSQNPIDRFVFSRLHQEGLGPAPAAHRAVLIRRASFGITGLPPTPSEIDAFVNDPSSNAFTRLVDRLLESAHYGEKWGRHWLDLVRYAESDGYRQDAYRPNAWRYRDYVVRAFNDDKPYNRFVAEQIAGDEIAPDDADAVVATGFLRHWLYEYNQRDARTQWDEILNDVTDVTADVFLGLGMGCARCHDHKFDPILQEDYFRLRAFFTGMIPRDDVAASWNERSSHAAKLRQWEAATADLRRQIDRIEAPYMAKATEDAVTKFPKDIQEIMAKPAESRSALDRQLAYLVEQQVRFEKEQKIKRKPEDEKRLEALRKELAGHGAQKPVPLPEAMMVADVGVTPGFPAIPGDRAKRGIEPGYLTVFHRPTGAATVPEPPVGPDLRRTLADWLTDPRHPLTTRVIVNRIWQYHFGRGLVATSSDFGRLGEPPSHPELLDWLASEFIDSGWSIKHLHRLILNTATYQQSAYHTNTGAAARRDPENRLLWRAPLRRLDAEQIRDAILACTGELDRQVGGPSVSGDKARRSIYVKAFRNNPDGFLKAFDVAEGLSSTPTRSITTTPTQSLLMINGEWSLQRADAFARRLVTTHPGSIDARVELAYRLAYGRSPETHERQQADSFLRGQVLKSRDKHPEQTALADFCHVLLNSNEFLYVE